MVCCQNQNHAVQRMLSLPKRSRSKRWVKISFGWIKDFFNQRKNGNWSIEAGYSNKGIHRALTRGFLDRALTLPALNSNNPAIRAWSVSDRFFRNGCGRSDFVGNRRLPGADASGSYIQQFANQGLVPTRAVERILVPPLGIEPRT